MKSKILLMTLFLLLASLFLAITGCEIPNPYFIRVASIEGVPQTGETGTPLTLTGTIRPAFASNKDIVWSVKEAGNTGASISGNILNAAEIGTVTVKAVIANGMAEGKEFTQDFKIVFSVPRVITNIAIKTQPAKLEYFEGETLDLSGITVTLTFDDASTEDIGLAQFKAKGITASPAHGIALTLAHNGLPIMVTASGKTANTSTLKVLEAAVRIGSTLYATLDDALTAAANGSASVPTEIIILRNITATSGYTIPENKHIKLTVESGNSFIITASAGNFTLFSITNTDSSLTLGPVAGGGAFTLSGGKAVAEADRRCIYVNGSGSTFTMNNGVTITGFNKSTTNTSGVHISSNGVFTMNGGEISGNTSLSIGGGVLVDNGGTFTMNDGKIKNNILNNVGDSGSGGGVYTKGTFIMKGGEISGNNVSYCGGGVYVATDGAFTMNGGEISNNKANVYGGGVAISGAFTMSGGKISGNTANSRGGGVFIGFGNSVDSTFTMSGGTIYGTNEANTSLRNNSGEGASVYFSVDTNSSAKYGNGDVILTTNNTITGHN